MTQFLQWLTDNLRWSRQACAFAYEPSDKGTFYFSVRGRIPELVYIRNVLEGKPEDPVHKYPTRVARLLAKSVYRKELATLLPH